MSENCSLQSSVVAVAAAAPLAAFFLLGALGFFSFGALGAFTDLDEAASTAAVATGVGIGPSVASFPTVSAAAALAFAPFLLPLPAAPDLAPFALDLVAVTGTGEEEDEEDASGWFFCASSRFCIMKPPFGGGGCCDGGGGGPAV